jgi:hypothetical protein
MKTTNRFGIFALATFGAALASGCMVSDFEEADMTTEDEVGEEASAVVVRDADPGLTIAQIEALRDEMRRVDPDAKITTHCAIEAIAVNASAPASTLRSTTKDPLDIGNCFFSEEELDAFLKRKSGSDAISPGSSAGSYSLTRFYADVTERYGNLVGAGDSFTHTASGTCQNGASWRMDWVGSYWNDKISFVEAVGTCRHVELYEDAYLSGYSIGLSNDSGASYPLTNQWMIWPFRNWNDEVSSMIWSGSY